MSSKSGQRAQQKRESKQARRAAAVGLLAVGTGAPLGAAVIVAPPADAAAFSVTNLNDSGAGSLRAAVVAANAAAGADTITFGGAAASGVIQLSTGELEITDDVTITGPGAAQLTVDAGGNSRVFNVHPATNTDTDAVVISGLTLTDGVAPSDTFYYQGTTYEVQQSGGAISATAYYSQAESLTVDDVVVTGSSASSGGAIDARGDVDLALSGSTMSANTALGGGGAIRSHGGTVEVADSTLSGNTGSFGGAISAGSAATIEGSIVSGNTASRGGGLFLYAFYAGTGGTIRNTVVSDNTAYYAGLYDGAGGGALLVADAAPMVLENVTVVDNATDGHGGGLRTSGGVQMTSTTISGNAAARGGGVMSTGSTGATLRNSIVANNTAPAAAERDLAVVDTLYNGPIKLDYTLVEAAPAAGSVAAITLGSNLVSQDPQLSPLADNGGPTKTMKPGLASPVIDRGKSFGLTTDQRGSTRPVDLAQANATGGDGADMGAVELASAAEANVVHNLAGPVIAGSAVVGSTLTEASAGSWDPAGVSLSRQWLRNGVPIPGATGTSYALAEGDAGATISLRVTAATSGYTPATATSMPAGPVAAGTLTTSGTGVIKGKLRVGRRLTAVPPACTPTASVKYQWMRGSKPIANATKVKYRLKRADKGKKISVRITFTHTGYNAKTITIKHAGRVKA